MLYDRCEKKFKNLFVKRYHLCIQETKYACPLGPDCDFLGIDLHEIEIHLEKMHTKKKLKCKLCEFVSTNKEDFKLHTQVEHKHVQVVISKEDMVEIKCDECEYKCHLNNQLRKHMATHVMALDIKCEICPFTTKEETEMKKYFERNLFCILATS